MKTRQFLQGDQTVCYEKDRDRLCGMGQAQILNEGRLLFDDQCGGARREGLADVRVAVGAIPPDADEDFARTQGPRINAYAGPLPV